MKDLGKKVIIIGSPGSGKSTFSRKLSELTGIPVIHLDKEFWNYGWIETSKEEWAKKHENLISGDQWIMDGNYGGTMDMRIENADTIICFQLSRAVCIMRYFKRVITNVNKTRLDMPEGCPEHFDFEFLKYISNFNKTSGKRNIERLEKNKYKHIIVFKRKNDADKYISVLRSHIGTNK